MTEENIMPTDEEPIKIICGDCLEEMKKIPDNSVDLIVTDPPFNISKKGAKISRKSMKLTSIKRNSDIKLDFGEWDRFENRGKYHEFIEKIFVELIRIMKNKAWCYIWFDKFETGFLVDLCYKYNMNPKTIIVWHKTNPAPQFRKVNWLSCTEFCFVFSKGNCKMKNYGYIKDMHTVWNHVNSSIYGKTEHPTEKPVELLSKMIKTCSNSNELVLDCFLGSGTTAVACKQLGRKCIGIEISPEYIEMAKKRLAQEVLKC